jgi:hypothetical protein
VREEEATMDWLNAIKLPVGASLHHREYIAVRSPGGTALVGRQEGFFKERAPDEAISELNKRWYIDIQTFDSLAEARAWAEEKGCEIHDLPEMQ